MKISGVCTNLAARFNPVKLNPQYNIYNQTQ